MKLFIKEGVIRELRAIIIHSESTQVINPTESMILADGWQPYNPPQAPQSEMPYDERVNNLIRERYSASQEFSILRQKGTKPQEYEEYFLYCEECKQRAKQ